MALVLQSQDVNVDIQSPPGTQAGVAQQLVSAVGSGDVAHSLQNAGYGVDSAQITSLNGQPFHSAGTPCAVRQSSNHFLNPSWHHCDLTVGASWAC